MRRCVESRVIASQSAEGSEPNTDSLKPPWPCCAAWQAAIEHPALFKIGRTCSENRIAGRSETPVTVTLTARVCPEAEMVICACPLLFAITTPPADTSATAGLLEANEHSEVTSGVRASTSPFGPAAETTS